MEEKKIAFCNSRWCADKNVISSVGVKKDIPWGKFYCPDCGHVIMWLKEQNTPGYRRAGSIQGKRNEGSKINGIL